MNYNEELKQIFLSKIPQLKQYDIHIDLDKWALLPEKTKCYLYKITNLTNEKIYLETRKICPVYYWGYHLGELPHLTLKLPYYHSSKNKVFKRMYFNSLSNVKIEIWSMGNKEAMTLQEHFELKSVKANKNKLYYNLSNGIPMTKPVVDLTKVDQLMKDYENEDLCPTQIKPKQYYADLLNNGKYVQIREYTNPEHIRAIRDRVVAAANIDDTKPVAVFEKRMNGTREGEKYINGEDCLGGSIHTLYAIDGLDSFDDIKVKHIPIEFTQHLNDDELEIFCRRLNPVEKEITLPRTQAEYVNELVVRHNNTGEEPSSELNKLILKGYGLYQLQPIITEAEETIKEEKIKGKRQIQGKTYIDYINNKVINLKLKLEIANLEKEETCVAIYGSTGVPGKLLTESIRRIRMFQLKYNKMPEELTIKAYHPEKSYHTKKQDWNAKHYGALLGELNLCFNYDYATNKILDDDAKRILFEIDVKETFKTGSFTK